MDDRAASPLVVLGTFVAAAVAITALVVYLVAGTPDRDLELTRTTVDNATAFEVTEAAGGIRWDDLTIRFYDAAGTDHAGFYLTVPDGAVTEGNLILFRREPPAGNYLLVLTVDDRVVARVSAVF